MDQITTREAADAAFQEEVTLLYKHSTRCPISMMAHREVQEFREAHPDVPVYLVDVNLRRDVSRYLAERTGIDHHSPQAILLHRGEAAWHGSHLDVSAQALGRQVELLRAAG